MELFRDRQNDFLQIRVARGIANHNFKVAWLNNVFHIDVVESEGFGRDVESDGFCFTRL